MRPQRTQAVKWEDIPGELPTARIPKDVDSEGVASEVVGRLPTLCANDLTDSAIWRDLLAFTDHFRTLHGKSSISTAASTLWKRKSPSDFQYVPGTAKLVRIGDESAWIDAEFRFATNGKLKGHCVGGFGIVPDSEESRTGWKIWMLRTRLENFEGHGHPDELQAASVTPPAEPATNGLNGSRASDGVLDAVIVGAGQAGLSMAGRLKALGCSYTVLERSKGVGDVWTDRYETLRWHTSKEYGNLPFDRTFLPEDDYMLTTKQIGSGFDRWKDRFGINVQVETAVQTASWDNSTGVWTINVLRRGEHDTLQTRNFILAIGTCAAPHLPDWPGRENYMGSAMHSADYRTSKPWAGKRGIVVGTANTAHDVVEDMLEAGFSSVTMVQRGHTFVFPAEFLWAAQDMDYNMEVLPVEGDRKALSQPAKIMRAVVNHAVHNGIDAHPQRFDDLEAAGFKLDRKGDIYDNLYSRFGGHYVDIGTSAKIARGDIKMKGEAVSEWTERGLRFEDGSEIEADLTVLSTGFDHDYRNAARQIVGDAADIMDDYFGVDGEGEIRGVYKYAGHPGLYYAGGDIRMCRYMSRFLALQIQSEVLGAPLDRYVEVP